MDRGAHARVRELDRPHAACRRATVRLEAAGAASRGRSRGSPPGRCLEVAPGLRRRRGAGGEAEGGDRDDELADNRAAPPVERLSQGAARPPALLAQRATHLVDRERRFAALTEPRDLDGEREGSRRQQSTQELVLACPALLLGPAPAGARRDGT